MDDDHATIFYCATMECYLMCFDNDIEDLPTPLRFRMPKRKLKPFELLPYNSGAIDRTWVTRIVYSPAHSMMGKRGDGHVDFYVVVTDSWLKRMAWQYQAMFPAGLNEQQLRDTKLAEGIF